MSRGFQGWNTRQLSDLQHTNPLWDGLHNGAYLWNSSSYIKL
jgi:hypothetical protein